MKAIFVAVVIIQLALAQAAHREKRSILIIPRLPRFPSVIDPGFGGGFFPGIGLPRIPLPVFNMTAKDGYDPLSQVCCRGNVFPYPKNADVSCCGDQSYDTNKQLCCDGVVKDRAQGAKCCGKDTYITDKAICCKPNNKVVPVTEEELKTASCCGDQKYDPKTELCCGGLRNEVKVLEKKNEGDYCCGMEVANSETQVCCGDLTTRGNAVMNSSYHIVPKDADSKKTFCCWGGKLYDPASQSCCGTELLDGANRVCCGDGGIDENNELCCPTDDGAMAAVKGNPSEARCCGSKASLIKDHMCCWGNLFDRKDNSSFCCGDKPVNTEEEFCILKRDNNGTQYETVKKASPDQDGVCGTTPFNRKTETCCATFDGLKVTKKATERSVLCCGDQTYEWNKSTCCIDRGTKQFKLHDGTSYTTLCCGLDTYDITTEMCCAGKKLPKSESSLCCGNTDVYDPSTQLCCGQRTVSEVKFAVVGLKGNASSCCGVNSYDQNTEICCNGKVFPSDGKAVCCGDQTYDVEKAICCGGSIIPTTDSKATSCCYAGLGGRATTNIGFDFDLRAFWGKK